MLLALSIMAPASASETVEIGGPKLVWPGEKPRVSLGYSTSFTQGRTQLSIWTRGVNRAALLTDPGIKRWGRPVGFSPDETWFEWKVWVRVTPAMRRYDPRSFRVLIRNTSSGFSRGFRRRAYVQLDYA